MVASIDGTPNPGSEHSPIAFLVDGDNASPSLIAEMLAEASKYGTVELRRVYGDWASGRFASWRAIVQEHAIVPIQQFANVAGKNATDSALIIDAMDILHEGRFLGFCIVSSDSDYTRLATRMREAGKFVIGVGRAQTPAAFRNACNVFVSTENLLPKSGSTSKSSAPNAEKRTQTKEAREVNEGLLTQRPVPKPPEQAVEILTKAFDSIVGPDGYCNLAGLGNALLRLDPSFDSRTFGSSKLTDLIDALPGVFELKRPPKGTTGTVLVRYASKK